MNKQISAQWQVVIVVEKIRQHKGSRLPGEISVTSDVQRTPPLWQKVKRS